MGYFLGKFASAGCWSSSPYRQPLWLGRAASVADCYRSIFNHFFSDVLHDVVLVQEKDKNCRCAFRLRWEVLISKTNQLRLHFTFPGLDCGIDSPVYV